MPSQIQPTPEAVLSKYFGYDSFRSGQKEIVEAILNGQDVLAILPTGGGKSICFQVPALILPGLTVVISPLISLMKDQVEQLAAAGAAATFLNSSLTQAELEQRTSYVRSGACTFVYVSPERLRSSTFLELLLDVQVSLVVVDEAHCLSEWGHDFRPSYVKIAARLAELPHRPPIAAFTATATPKVADEIAHRLRLISPRVFRHPTSRTNLTLTRLHCASLSTQRLALLRSVWKHHRQPMIIYVATRNQAEQLRDVISRFLLCRTGLPLLRNNDAQIQIDSKTRHRNEPYLPQVGYYHGGLSTTQRDQVQDKFLKNEISIIVATTAFGMGINKTDIRSVIHFHPSASLEQYVQEVGRAGRDGEQSFGYLLFNPANLEIHAQLIQNYHTSQQQRKRSQLDQMVSFATQPRCCHATIGAYFGDAVDASSDTRGCARCDHCLRLTWSHPLIVGMQEEGERQMVRRLLEWRAAEAARQKIPPTSIAPDSIITFLAVYQPRSLTSLQLVPGIGTGWIKTQGNPYISLFRTPY